MASALSLPKYHRIYLVLREQLQEGRFDRDLPGELALATEPVAGAANAEVALDVMFEALTRQTSRRPARR